LDGDKASEIARVVVKDWKNGKQVVLEKNLKIKGDLDDLLDPTKMA